MSGTPCGTSLHLIIEMFWHACQMGTDINEMCRAAHRCGTWAHLPDWSHCRASSCAQEGQLGHCCVSAQGAMHLPHSHKTQACNVMSDCLGIHSS